MLIYVWAIFGKLSIFGNFFTSTLYTSGTTLMPLLALIFFGGSTLYWFAIALALGVVIGSWSSIALAPSLLSLFKDRQRDKLIENAVEN